MRKSRTDHGEGDERPAGQTFPPAPESPVNDGLRRLQESLALEKLLVNISARLVSSALATIDGEIEQALHQVRDFFQVDRCGLLEVLADRNVIRVSHASYAEGVGQVSGDINLAVMFPWASEKLFGQRMPLSITSTKDLPPEADTDRQAWAAMGVRSSLKIPLLQGDRVSHIIVIQNMREERCWPDEFIPRLHLLGEIFVSALMRRQADLALRDSEARLTLAAESAEVDLWSMEVGTGRLWGADTLSKKLGIGLDEVFSLDLFLGFVHPEDREKLLNAVQEAIQSRQLTSVEYRVTYADGTIHWLVSRGAVQVNDAGEPDRLMGVTIDNSEHKQMEELTRRQYREIQELKLRLEHENIYLQKEIKSLFPHNRIVGQSAVMKSVVTQAMQVAQTDSTVLILGETGTGKELLARAIHDQSSRKGRPLITVNCASLPPSLIEAELFGREKGAYTGALSRMIGRFELADESTIFLDEIGELPLELQVKLLRVIETRSFERLGSATPITVNVRIIAATNRELFADVKSGSFRSDLYYRLNVFPIQIPPLRERPEDIPPLVWSLVKEFQESMGNKIERIPEKTMNVLTSYHWPGNVRELRNVIERAMIVSPGTSLDVIMPKNGAFHRAPSSGTLEEIVREHIMAVLSSTNWRVTGKGGAAAVLGLERTTLYSKMKKLGINRPEP